jgi:hypothetical protein
MDETAFMVGDTDGGAAQLTRAAASVATCPMRS